MNKDIINCIAQNKLTRLSELLKHNKEIKGNICLKWGDVACKEFNVDALIILHSYGLKLSFNIVTSLIFNIPGKYNEYTISYIMESRCIKLIKYMSENNYKFSPYECSSLIRIFERLEYKCLLQYIYNQIEISNNKRLFECIKLEIFLPDIGKYILKNYIKETCF